jgi:hypothetical protein
MDSRDDLTYHRLFENFTGAMQGYKNAITDRKRIRNLLAVKRSPVLQAFQQHQRRPVGSPQDFRIPKPAQHRSVINIQGNKERRIYLGHILGFAKIIYTQSITPEPEPDMSIEFDKLYDQTSLRLYWNVKKNFDKSKKDFLDFSHRNRTREALNSVVNRQYLGVEDDDTLSEGRREVEAGCVKNWNFYKSSPTPKSMAAISILLESLADANFVDLDSPTVKSISQEVSKLIMSGTVKKER